MLWGPIVSIFDFPEYLGAKKPNERAVPGARGRAFKCCESTRNSRPLD